MITSRAHTEMDGKNPRFIFNVRAQAGTAILNYSLLELACDHAKVICLLYYFVRHL